MRPLLPRRSGEMRDAQHLRVPAQPPELPPTSSAALPPMPASTSSKINVAARRQMPARPAQRQHHARQLSARRDPRERSELLSGVRRHEELSVIDATRRPLGLSGRRRSKSHGKACPRHRERVQARLESRRERLRRLPARSLRASPASDRYSARGHASQRSRDLYRPRVELCQIGQFLVTAGVVRHDVRKRRTVFRFSRSTSASRSSTCCSRSGDASMAVGIARAEKRQVLELRLDRLPRPRGTAHARDRAPRARQPAATRGRACPGPRPPTRTVRRRLLC